MSRLFNKMDKVLLILTIIMFVFGLFMILDASNMKSFLEYGTNTKYFNKQLIILIISFFASLIILKIPTKKYKRIVIPVTLVLLFFLLYLLFFGEETSGAKSWVYIGTFGLQPSEFAKLGIILLMSSFYKANLRTLDSWKTILTPIVIGVIYFALVFLQPDGGTSVIIFLITAMLFYASPVKKDKKLKLTLHGAAFVVIMALLLVIFKGSIFSSMQRFIAINNGKLISISPGNSQQKYLYLPEAFTDFIFPIIVEEFGLITGIAIVLMLMVMIYRILVLAKKSVSVQNAMICYGVACYIFLHTIINLVGVLGLMPLTGVPLPFFSYGGSFALTLAISLAIVQRISIENYNYMQKKVLENQN